MLTTATKNKINTARDILVGKIPMPTSQVEQITLALVYKFMSDMDKKARELGDTSGFFANGYEKYSWDKLMDKSLPARDRVKLYGEGLEKMALNPHIPQLFRDIFRNAFLPFNDPETLKLFLDTIDQFEYDHSEELGNAFEYLLQIMGSQGDAGQFRTPRHIIDFIVEVLDPSKNDRILDPACGTAGFLISAYKHIKSKGLTNDEMKTISNNFVGYDISQDMQRLSLVNLYLHHFPDPHIYEYDTLTSEDRWNDDFDVVLANPPFMTPKGGIRPHNRFSVPSNRAEVLFVDYIMEHLTVNGKAGVIVPEGIIFQSQNAYQKLRKMMVDDDFLWAVVSLPSGVFQPYSGVKTSILLFDRQLAKKTNKVLFIRVNNDGYDLGAQRRPTKLNDLPQALETLRQYKQGLIESKEVELGSNELAHIVEKKIIRESDYALSGERYKKTILSKLEKSTFKKLGELVSIVTETVIPNGINHNTLYVGLENIEKDTGRLINIGKVENNSLKSAKSKFKKNDLLYAKLRPNLNKAWLAESDGICSTDILVIRSKNDEMLPAFLKHIFLSMAFNEEVLKGISGSQLPRVNKSHFLNIEIPILPLLAQHELVKELGGYQKIVDLAKEMTQIKGVGISINQSWDEVQLDDICQMEYGLTATGQDEGNLRLIRITDINEYGELSNDNVKFVASNDESKKYILNRNDVLVARTGATYGKTLLFDSNQPSVFASYLIRLKLDKEKILPEYYWCFAQSQNYWNQAKSLVTGGGQPQFNGNALKNVIVPLPPLEIQKTIAEDFLKIRNQLVKQNNELIDIFKKKIETRIDEIWGTTI